MRVSFVGLDEAIEYFKTLPLKIKASMILGLKDSIQIVQKSIESKEPGKEITDSIEIVENPADLEMSLNVTHPGAEFYEFGTKGEPCVIGIRRTPINQFFQRIQFAPVRGTFIFTSSVEESLSEIQQSLTEAVRRAIVGS